MAGLILFRAARGCPPAKGGQLAERMRQVFLKHRDLHGSIAARSLEAPALCHVTKFDAPHSSVAGILQHRQHGSWLTGVGLFSYRGQSVAAEPSVLEELLADALVSGLDVYEHLNGLFVVAYYNANTRTVWILPSVTGAQPVFVRQSEAGVGVATSVLSLATLGPLSVDPVAVYSQLRSQRFPAPHTLFKEISSVPFGHALEIREARVVKHRVWAPALKRCPETNVGEAAERISACLVESCKALLDGRWKVVADLTGGYDSRTACAALLHAGGRFSCTVSGTEDDPDVVSARRIAAGEQLGLKVLRPPVAGTDELLPHLCNAVKLGEGQQDALTLGKILYDKTRLNAAGLVFTVYGLYGEFYRDRTYSHGHLVNLDRPGPVRLERLVKYSQYYDGSPWPAELFRHNWREAWREALLQEMQAVAGPFQEASRGAQLDAVFLNKEATHAGAPNHAMLPLYPHVAPLGTPRALSIALGVPPRWRRGARLQTEVVRRLAPGLALYPLATGCPFAPVSVRNWHRFLPHYGAKYTRYLKQVSPLGALAGAGRRPQSSGPGILAGLIERERHPGGALHYSSMVTAEMYERTGFLKLLTTCGESGASELNLVSSIYTLEMLARLAGLCEFRMSW